jgi:general secretion pathway protein A
MYQRFYGLKEKPFVLTPDPQFLFLSESHRTAIESLLYGIQQKEGFMVITGDIGTGKTTICRALLERLDRNVKTAVIFNSFLTEEELLEAILRDFGFTSKGRTKKERIDALNKIFISFLSHGKNAVLIIDEAQNLSIPVLEQIRMLSNLETEKEKLLQIIFFGQLELDQKLRSAELKQLNQRIAVRHYLLPLTPRETESYIYQRLLVAGSLGSITFSRSALYEIYKFSRGAPRLINLLCDRALLAGFIQQTYYLDKEMIKLAKDSLLGEEESSKPYHSFVLSRNLASFRFPFFTLFILLMLGLILAGQGLSSSLQNAKNLIWKKVQSTCSQVSGSIPPSVSALPLDIRRLKNPVKNEPQENSERPSQEGSQ